MTTFERAKVTVALTITAVVEVSDDGYLGTGESLAKHIHKAKTDAQGWRFLVQQGTIEPKAVRTTVTVNSVTIVPKED